MATVLSIGAKYSIAGKSRYTKSIAGMFFATLAYLQYQRILNVDWHKLQAISQNGMAWLADAVTHGKYYRR
ncbi:MAG: FUN14 domain-containing protein [Candidatus Nitrosopolaris sp.]